MSKWISVKEKLPENKESVLVFCGNQPPPKFIYMAQKTDFEYSRLLNPSIKIPENYYAWFTKRSTELLTNAEVTHWMPLPNPPTEEKPNELIK